MTGLVILSFRLFFFSQSFISSTCFNKFFYIKADLGPLSTVGDECERLGLQPNLYMPVDGLSWQFKCYLLIFCYSIVSDSLSK